MLNYRRRLKMTESEVVNKLLDLMRIDMDKAGFKLLRSRDQFERKTDLGKDIFNLMSFKSETGFTIEPNIWIVNKRIEKIYHAITHREKEFHKSTVTLGNGLATLINNPDDVYRRQYFFRFPINKERDFENVAKRLLALFQGFASEYFSKYGSVSSVDKLFNAYPIEISVHCNLNPERFCKGIIAAKLLGNPNYSRLIENYSIEIQKAPDHFQNEFSRCVDYLNSITYEKTP